MKSNKPYSAIFIPAMLFLFINFVFISFSWADDSKRIEMTAKEFFYKSDHLTVKRGEMVVIMFHNEGVLSHNLSIDGLDEKTETIYPGETDKLVFTPKKSGEYSFRCTVPGHAEAGMRGTLIVR